MRFIPGLLALGFLVILPTGLSGRQHGCNLIRSGDWNIFNAGAPNEVVFMGGPVHFECDGGITVKADSAVRMPERLQLIGQVFYGDSVKTLTSRQLDYFPREGRLFARGDVEYLDRATGSTIQGQELHHERESAVRAESRTVVQGRPHGVFRPQRRDGAAADTATQPFEVDAEWMEFIGQRAFRASGNVELVRGALRGFSNWAEFDNETERLVLTGSARVLDEQYELTAERIEAVLVGEQLSELFASTNARLTGEDVTIESYEIRMFTDDGALSRLVARTRGGLPDPNADRVRATAEELLLLADSLDVLAPGQRIETLIAVGRAYAERTADTVDVGLPEIAAKDWVRGDTITGHFAPATKAADPDTAASASAADSSRNEVVLERLIASGPNGTAQALFRFRDRNTGPEDPPAISYTIADRIVLVLRNGEVEKAEAVGENQDIRGIHLQPNRRSERAERPSGRNDAAAAEKTGSS